MTVLRLKSETIPVTAGQSVLDALLAHGVAVPNSCRSGVCQSCLMRLEDPSVEIPAAAQAGLKVSLRVQGYFLACSWQPTADLAVALPGEGLDFHTTVLANEDLGAAVRRVRLAVPEGFAWRAGQFLTLLRNDGLARSYSIASRPEDGWLELHVRRIPGGAMSGWLHDVVQPGDATTVRGPFGECFYTTGRGDDTLLLAGTGTGLAPLLGVLREALAQGHAGPIRLFHGAVSAAGLYLRDELASLCARHANVRVQPVVLHAEGACDECVVGALDEVLLSAAPSDWRTARAWLCGDPMLVARMRKRLFMAGLSNRSIFADPFVPSAPA